LPQPEIERPFLCLVILPIALSWQYRR